MYMVFVVVDVPVELECLSYSISSFNFRPSAFCVTNGLYLVTFAFTGHFFLVFFRGNMCFEVITQTRNLIYNTNLLKFLKKSLQKKAVIIEFFNKL